jgi:cellulose synthase/poly-beta-1,6-N-acetylglucosamine synthase-like glycosyltransferase
LIIFITVISLIYISLIISLIVGFKKLKSFTPQKEFGNIGFSIIIPFRNEANNIPELAQSLLPLNYPLDQFEILWIDDDSTDNSVEIIKKWQNKISNWTIIKNHRKTNSPKKDAINTAINLSKFDWIVTTDADCIVNKNWLQSFAKFIDSKKKTTDQSVSLIAGPVSYKINNTFIQQFQNFDFMSLIGSTIGGFGINKPFLCNGANLAYKKEAFFKVNGFVGNDNIASGDDIFLLEKMLNYNPNGVLFLKAEDAIVTTKPETTFGKLLSQRIRWASKTSSYKNNFGKGIGLSVFMMNLSIIILAILSIINHEYLYSFLSIFIIKLGIDFILIHITKKFFKQPHAILTYILSAICYPFFIILVAFLSLFKSYNWKGRQFKS